MHFNFNSKKYQLFTTNSQKLFWFFPILYKGLRENKKFSLPIFLVYEISKSMLETHPVPMRTFRIVSELISEFPISDFT